MEEQALAQLQDELQKLISEYQHYESWDQRIVFGLVWASILASAIAALLTALSVGPKWAVACIAAVPALCLTVESSFKFSQQYQLRRAATADLLALQDELRYEGLKPAEASKRMREIVRAFKTGSFVPTLSAASSQKPSQPANGPGR